MTRKIKAELIAAGATFIAFVITLILVKCADVREIGPENTSIGMAALNAAFRDAIGFSETWYSVSDILGFVVIGIAAGTAGYALLRIIRKKSDASLVILCGFYLVIAGIYLLFEVWIINYRPVLIDGELEASFPSSHTFLSVFVTCSSTFQFRRVLSNKTLGNTAAALTLLIGTAVVVGRILSGAHWFTDILAAAFIGSSLILFYLALAGIADAVFGKAVRESGEKTSIKAKKVD